MRKLINYFRAQWQNFKTNLSQKRRTWSKKARAKEIIIYANTLRHGQTALAKLEDFGTRFRWLSPRLLSWLGSAIKNYARQRHNLYLLNYWQYLLQETKNCTSAEINFTAIQILLVLKPSLLDVPLPLPDSNEQITLLNLVILKSPTRFDVIKYLIFRGAVFDRLLGHDYMCRHCDVMPAHKVDGLEKQYTANSIYYLAAAVQNIGYEADHQAEYLIAKAAFKEIVDYIISLEQPATNGRGKANYQMTSGFPLIAYMPSEDLIHYLINQGADPQLLNSKEDNVSIADTLYATYQYDRLRWFALAGCQVSNLKDKLMKRQDQAWTAYYLLTPPFSEQLSDLDKAHIISFPMLPDIDRWRYSGWWYPVNKLKINMLLKSANEPELSKAGHLRDLIFHLSISSLEIYHIFLRFNIWVMLGRCSVECAQLRDEAAQHWERQTGQKQEPKMAEPAWKFLPRGYAPRFDYNKLNESQNDPQTLCNNAFEVLGIPVGSSRRCITLAYRRLSRENHPDRSNDSYAADDMVCLNQARKILLGV